MWENEAILFTIPKLIINKSTSDTLIKLKVPAYPLRVPT